MQHRQFGDGRIVYNPAEYGYEYHYYHKDHLGNIRQVFRAESTTTYMATMEPENETQEMQQFFHNLSDSRSIDARYNQTEGGRAVAYLDASRGRDYGPVWSKELAQGDSLHAAVLGMLYDPKEKPKLKDLLTGIGRQNSLLTSGELTSMTNTSSLGLQPLWLALQLARQLEKAPVPESYLGYILYDQDSVRYDSGRVEISRNAFTNPEELALDITATQGGFVEVYVYNASASPVWYDQFSISSSQAVIIQENHYYPFGMQIAGLELDLDSRNRYLYNGKELQDDHNLDWHDYGARMYDAQIGRWHVKDPMADERNWLSPYNYVQNNPMMRVDPTGALDAPIYDENANFLGTDDEGLQGKAIVMNKDDFKQGMSHEDALSKSLGVEGLKGEGAKTKLFSHYIGLKDRPDYDGYLTLSEANKWYKEGNGQPLFTSLAKIDLSGILSLGENYVGEKGSYNLLLNSNSVNDGLVYGSITLKRYSDHHVRAYADEYNFEMHNARNPLNWPRNAETLIGRKVAGEGEKFDINIYGSKKLTPILPWIK